MPNVSYARQELKEQLGDSINDQEKKMVFLKENWEFVLVSALNQSQECGRSGMIRDAGRSPWPLGSQSRWALE